MKKFKILGFEIIMGITIFLELCRGQITDALLLFIITYLIASDARKE